MRPTAVALARETGARAAKMCALETDRQAAREVRRPSSGCPHTPGIFSIAHLRPAHPHSDTKPGTQSMGKRGGRRHRGGPSIPARAWGTSISVPLPLKQTR